MELKIPINGEEYPTWAVNVADHFMEMTKRRPMWEVIDLIVEVWMKKNIKDKDAFVDYIIELKGTRKNKFASTETEQGELKGQRHLGEMPQEIATLIDIFYREEIKKTGEKKFYHDFFRRYPIFKVADII